MIIIEFVPEGMYLPKAYAMAVHTSSLSSSSTVVVVSPISALKK